MRAKRLDACVGRLLAVVVDLVVGVEDRERLVGQRRELVLQRPVGADVDPERGRLGRPLALDRGVGAEHHGLADRARGDPVPDGHQPDQGLAGAGRERHPGPGLAGRPRGGQRGQRLLLVDAVRPLRGFETVAAQPPQPPEVPWLRRPAPRLVEETLCAAGRWLRRALCARLETSRLALGPDVIPRTPGPRPRARPAWSAGGRWPSRRWRRPGSRARSRPRRARGCRAGAGRCPGRARG